MGSKPDHIGRQAALLHEEYLQATESPDPTIRDEENKRADWLVAQLIKEYLGRALNSLGGNQP